MSLGTWCVTVTQAPSALQMSAQTPSAFTNVTDFILLQMHEPSAFTNVTRAPSAFTNVTQAQMHLQMPLDYNQETLSLDITLVRGPTRSWRYGLSTDTPSLLPTVAAGDPTETPIS
jgi:hypothetical protein